MSSCGRLRRTTFVPAMIVPLLALTSCMGSYKPPVTVTEAARITTIKGYAKTGLGTGANQQYLIATGDVCAPAKKLSGFTVLSGSSKTAAVEPGKLTFIDARSDFLSSSAGYAGVDIISTPCRNIVSFTPEKGRSYTIVQRSEYGRNCRIEIVDDATKAAPIDAKLVDFSPCAKVS